MPYIKQEDRTKFSFDGLKDIKTAGELNYVITSICHEYIKSHELRYHILNEVVGALECAKLELYRRIVSPYEDTTITKNGDVNLSSSNPQ